MNDFNLNEDIDIFQNMLLSTPSAASQIKENVSAPVRSPAMPTNQKSTKKMRQKKGEYMKKLEEENSLLRQQIAEFEQKIKTTEAQNAILLKEVDFFKKLPAGIAPNPAQTEPERFP